MGADDTAHTAAARLRLLVNEFTTPRRTGGAAESPVPRQLPTQPSTPVDLGMLDYVQRQIGEIIDHTRQAAPDAGPPPADVVDSYRWMRDHTAHAAPEQRLARDAMMERHSLEHALAMGDTSVIRRITCPRCHCWSLFWQSARRVAACVNRRCLDRGRPSLWTLRQLAEYRVQKRAVASRTAT